MKTLDNQVAIVTGGSRGIGKTIALELARNGAKVVINYNSNADAANEVVKEIEALGSVAFASQADVSDSAQAKVLVEETINRFGKVDILVNNAGITRDRSFLKLTEEAWRKVIDVNLNSAFNTTSAVLPLMVEQKYGRIINISSIIGQSGNVGQTNYAASKAGLIGFTKSLALEMANKGVTVNAICPGFIETEMVAEIPAEILDKIVAKIPQRRLGQPSEIARAVCYLVTDGDYITGQQLNVNGGLYM
ncbi:3-oxoacyl-[acyl-carrier-protein] reductase [Ammoniphilus sp. CFH 90114]|uniref:3-oxoacyl-[acyl-carrier-protein] reductase n=1 Tax=Ammoniphilus sp. CFH 90114 TaxID=2493665 RepID=UPI00100F6B70|nr:3-oxoacyl-[acyl-carrier-protein] reductase [Ammoniphilus sp. CFH 90114]RXT13538.1 3-oxoacyl-[acyl-carrier-protein] reductase [Ammoniphilus sp. CFH 90114]